MTARWRRATAFVRDPLVVLVVSGGVLFGLHAWLAPDEASEPPDARVVVTDDFVDELVRVEAERTGARPESLDREALARAWARDEALYREATRLGLGRGDSIVRRRLVQKLELVLAARAEIEVPPNAEVDAFVDAHEARYRAPVRVAFDHVFFARDRREDAEGDAQRARAALSDEVSAREAARLGDAFLTGASEPATDARALAGRFGAAFAEAVFARPVGGWSDPIGSSVGVHLVRVKARNEAGVDHDAVRARAREDLVEARRAAAVEAEVRAIVARATGEGAE
jgi:hypothetical protein